MAFRYQPEHFEPDPWPVDGPTELSDNEYRHALATIDSPYISNILAALRNAGGRRVVCWMLFLGQHRDSPPREDRPAEDVVQGYYIRAIVRDRDTLRRELERYGGLTGAARGEAGQLALSVQMIPLDPVEVRDRVVGWAFVAQ